MKATALAPGSHPGFARLKSQPNVFRAKLRQETKAKPEHADYAGVFNSTGRRTLVRLWVHADGSLGLRVELNPPEKGKAA